MVAAPYKGTVTARGVSGSVYSEPFDADDVVDKEVLFKSPNQRNLLWPEDVEIIDITLSAEGTDTKRLQVKVGNLAIPVQWRKNSLLDTRTLPRLPAPIGVRGNKQFILLELA